MKNLVNFFGFIYPLPGVWGILYEQHTSIYFLITSVMHLEALESVILPYENWIKSIWHSLNEQVKNFIKTQTSSLDTDTKKFKESMSTLNSFIKNQEVDLVTKISKAHQAINDHDKAIKNKIETAYSDFQRLMICDFQKSKQSKIVISIFRIYYANENKLSKFYSLSEFHI